MGNGVTRASRATAWRAPFGVCVVLAHASGCGSSLLAEHRLIRSVVFESESGDGHAIDPQEETAWDAEPRLRRPEALVLVPDDG